MIRTCNLKSLKTDYEQLVGNKIKMDFQENNLVVIHKFLLISKYE